MAKRFITNERAIDTFLHCGKCMREKSALVSAREWASLEVGFTEQGLQVWCKRHEVNVVHIDFEGQSHPANASMASRPPPSLKVVR